PISLHHPRALPERDLSLRPSPACCSIGCPRNGEIGNGGDVVENGIAIVGPSVHAGGGRHDASPPGRRWRVKPLPWRNLILAPNSASGWSRAGLGHSSEQKKAPDVPGLGVI